MSARLIDWDGIVARPEVLLLDAYGVLVDSAGPLPGAVELVQRLNREGREYFLLTNDASRLPSTMSARFSRFGLSIAPESIISSGSLLTEYARLHGLENQTAVVLGTEDSHAYARQAGLVSVTALEAHELSVLIVADEAGYPFLESVDHALSLALKAIDDGQEIRLVLPNPDLVYPKPQGFGLAAGSVARAIEEAIRLRHPDRASTFDRLGKPNAMIFEEAVRRAKTRKLLMIGDQLETDIRGARDFGIDSVLVPSGVTAQHVTTDLATYVLKADR